MTRPRFAITSTERNFNFRLLSRNGKDFMARFSSLARVLEALPDDTMIDAEIGADGRAPVI
jgi:ATP-dependent DNA ligase